MQEHLHILKKAKRTENRRNRNEKWRKKRSQQNKGRSSPVTGLEWPRGFQEVKVPTYHDNGTGWW
jgi:hypothetical protein